MLLMLTAPDRGKFVRGILIATITTPIPVDRLGERPRFDPRVCFRYVGCEGFILKQLSYPGLDKHGYILSHVDIVGDLGHESKPCVKFAGPLTG
jgi:hypothetical protein